MSQEQRESDFGNNARTMDARMACARLFVSTVEELSSVTWSRLPSSTNPQFKGNDKKEGNAKDKIKLFTLH